MPNPGVQELDPRGVDELGCGDRLHTWVLVPNPGVQDGYWS